MVGKKLRKARILYLVSSLLIIFILYPLNLFGKEEHPEKACRMIEIKDKLISVNIKDVPLAEILKEIERQTGIKVTVVGKGLMDKKITVNFKDRDIEDALKTILDSNYIFVFTKDSSKKGYTLKEASAVNKTLAPKRRIVNKEIAYGTGKENIGAVRAGEGANIGPNSFTVDDQGNVYICDTANERVQIFSSDGKHLSTIPLEKGMMAEDIAIDRDGFIYIYYAQGELYQYAQNGSKVNKIHVDESRWDSRGPMHIINNEIYVRGSGTGDVLAAKVVDGKITAPADEELKKPLEKGVYGSSGKRYIALLKEDEGGGEIEVVEKDGTTSTAFIPLKGIFSIEFLGEDGKGNSYVKTEGDKNNELIVEVHEFNAKGDYAGTIPIPGDDYDLWAIKSLAVNKDGGIYQFMPGKDKLTINTFPR